MNRIDEIHARCEAATPGPWRISINMLIVDGNGHALFHGRGAKTNAYFIAHAREDIPFLLAEIDRLTEIWDMYGGEQGVQKLLEENQHLTREVAQLKEIAEWNDPRPVNHEWTLVGQYRCPSCAAAFIDGMGRTPFCGNCGQALEWPEKENANV